MARSDLLINLVRTGSAGDLGGFKRTVDAIVAEERAKQHNVVADQLERARAVGETSLTPLNRPVSEASQRAKDFIVEIKPQRKLDELILPQLARISIDQLVEEQARASVLRSHSVEPRHRILLIGPPGNGKTSLAEAVAESLSVPMFVVRYEGMIGSYLGETAGRLRRVFEYARTTPCVLFFDEFDAVGKERGDTHETGEIKRVVTTLLMQIDDLPSYVVVIAATNHAELLDKAVWRRFQLRVTLPSPSLKEIERFFVHLTRSTHIDLGKTPAAISKALGAVSYSEAEEFFLNLVRRQILSLGTGSSAEIAREQLSLWQARTNVLPTKRRGSARGRTPNT
jgi:AAA+ superfamily predicted ATPase